MSPCTGLLFDKGATGSQEKGLFMKDMSRRQFLTLLTAASALAGCGSSAEIFEPQPAPTSTSFDPVTEARLSKAVDEVFAQIQAPGLIAGVWVGRQAWAATRGTTTRNGLTPVNTDLYTRIGSITKTLTGTLILQLIQEGQLSFDDTLDTWFPSIQGADAITIRHLGSMASGLASYTDDETITDQYFANPTTVWDPEELLLAAAELDRPFLPGQGFLYCNTNLVALGLIAERILQAPLAELLLQRIFLPAGMTQSSYPYGTELPSPHWSGYTVQSVDDGIPINATNWSPTFAAGAGQAVATFRDLYIWARALGTGSLLSSEIQAARLVPNPHSVAGVRSYCFALGNDNGWLAHSGELPGFNTQIAYLPSLDATIVAMANADIASEDGQNPAPKLFTAIAQVIAPNNVP